MKNDQMIENEEANKKGPSPVRDLFIYVLEGNINTSDEERLGVDFIGNWVEGDSSFLFFTKPSKDRVDLLIQSDSRLSLSDQFQFTYEEWQGGKFDSLKIDPFLILPPWNVHVERKNEILIQMDPGVVFGNGLHPTTRDCLKALHFTATERMLSSVLDLGTGTGILALAAALLGAGRVIAVDLNPLCVRTAANNIKLNKLDHRISVIIGSAEDHLKQDMDLIVANIHYDVMKNIIKKENLKGVKRLILSGLMRSQSRNMEHQILEMGFKLVREWDQEMTWYTTLCERD